MTKRQIGCFKITPELLDNPNDPGLRLLMSKVIVGEARFNYRDRCIDYVAMSDLFEKVEDNCAAPDYQIIFTRWGGSLSVRAEKVQNAIPLRSSFKQKILNLKIALNAFLP